MLESWPVTPATVRALRDFADGAFDMASMRAAASGLGVLDFDPDPMLVVFDLPDGGVLRLAAADETADRVGAAIVTVAGWDNAGRDPVADPGRSAFDGHFDHVMATVRTTIGAPDRSGVDEASFGFRWAVWSGATGIMAAQQSWYDYCPDINIWVRPRPLSEFTLTSPFVEWLMSTP
jgi:hypothetical protein